MIGIIDFKKSSGEKVPNLEEYVKEYVNTHKNIDVMVGTDSQSKGSKTVFSTVVAMYDHGDGIQGHGAHCIFKRWTTPRYKKEQRFERLIKETEESINTANKLRDFGIKVQFIDIDINPDPKYKSNEAFNAAYGWVTGEGYDCRWKTLGPLITSFADWLVKEKKIK